MEVGNEMETFIKLTKYNTRQWHEEGNPPLVMNYLVSLLLPLIIVSNIFMRLETYHIMFIGMVYNNLLIQLKTVWEEFLCHNS